MQQWPSKLEALVTVLALILLLLQEINWCLSPLGKKKKKAVPLHSLEDLKIGLTHYRHLEEAGMDRVAACPFVLLS